MPALHFGLPDGAYRDIEIRYAFNCGYAGRDSAGVQHHIEESAALGVPALSRFPTLYPLSAMVVAQVDKIQSQHERTSGEAEWALVAGDTIDDLLLTCASDHTDRALEVHGVAWSKQSAPNLLGDLAWPLATIADRLDEFTLKAWVCHGAVETLIQDGFIGQLLSPAYWLKELSAIGLLRRHMVMLSGTLPMLPGVNQFGDGWRVEPANPDASCFLV